MSNPDKQEINFDFFRLFHSLRVALLLFSFNLYTCTVPIHIRFDIVMACGCFSYFTVMI